MQFGQILLWILGIAGAGGLLYGLHRLCLWLEDRGQLYYLRKKSSSTSAGAFVALQQSLEPQARHVIQVTEAKKSHEEDEAPGES